MGAFFPYPSSTVNIDRIFVRMKEVFRLMLKHIEFLFYIHTQDIQFFIINFLAQNLNVSLNFSII